MSPNLSLVLIFFTVGLTVSKANAEQFNQWYYIYNWALVNSAGENCYPNYTRLEWPEYKEYPHKVKIDNCKNMASCLLSNLDDFDKADMQSAAVLLGLMPTFLSNISPTLDELALVSLRRPVLATLVAIASPVTSVTRLFELTSIGDGLSHQYWPIPHHKNNTVNAAVLSITQYTVVAGAIALCLWNSISLGQKTILSWKCLFPYMQLCWNFMPLVPFFFDAVSLRYSKSFQKRESKRTSLHFLSRWLHSEFIPSAYQTRLGDYTKPEDREKNAAARIAIYLKWAASTCAFVHFVFGTLVFSSVLFIGTLNALGVVSLYLLSAILCRGVILFEIGGLKGAEPAETADKPDA